MKVSTEPILDALSLPEPCLSAFFSTFTFDPVFFENHVLRAVLRISSDPIEQPERYHQECRGTLQQVPVAVVVDASERAGGRRLPYDLLEVASPVFHPKTVVLLSRHYARLVVGSGNLTSQGYGGNSELFFRADLFYDQPSDVGVLASFLAHLKGIARLIRKRGSQLDLFEEELTRAIGNAADVNTRASFRLLDSTAAPLLQQVLDLLPPDAKLRSIGLAAPFFEKDDEGELDASSVFGALLQRADKKVDVDVAVGWDNISLHVTDPVSIEAGLGRLWTWEHGDHGKCSQVHIVPTSLGPKELRYRNERGEEKRCSVTEVRQAISAGKLWVQSKPIAFVPGNLFQAAGRVASQRRLWLHPSARLVEGRPHIRPLHAKLLTLAYESAGEPGTLLVMGSPNMSRRALLLAVRDGGNVEVAVALLVRQRLSVADLMPGIVLAPEETVSLRERTFPAGATNYALAVEHATHDPQAGTLTVCWSDQASKLPPWRLAYQTRELAASSQPPIESLHVDPFVLQPASAELTLHIAERHFSIPILVSDLVYLPADATARPLNLDELLMLAAGRIGGERANQMARNRTQQLLTSAQDDALAAYFKERFTPTDVFRAWRCLAEDLRNPALSVNSFRLSLEGATGTMAVWAAIRQAAKDGYIPPEEAWLYGAELLKTLGAMKLADDDSGETLAKRNLLSAFRLRVQADLRPLLSDEATSEIVRKMKAFYTETRVEGSK